MKIGGQGIVGGVFLLLMVISFVPASAIAATYPSPFLKVGFYKRSCPAAERIVSHVVRKAVALNPGIGAGLIRLHFHDCFVNGCDGSVLLKSRPGGPQVEGDHPANKGLRGFNAIDKAKRIIESICPNTISCADILAFAARDSSRELGRIDYRVPAGRRDGRVSNFSEVAQKLPSPTLNADQLIQNFARKGLSADEMVTLSGAHSIGVSHCSSFEKRLYSFNATHPQDPSLDRSYAVVLKARCPRPPFNRGRDSTVSFNSATPNRLDNTYYKGLRAGRGLLTSDQTLEESPQTRKYVNINARYGIAWAAKFPKATVKMGIDVLTGNKGEIRRTCSVVTTISLGD